MVKPSALETWLDIVNKKANAHVAPMTPKDPNVVRHLMIFRENMLLFLETTAQIFIF